MQVLLMVKVEYASHWMHVLLGVQREQPEWHGFIVQLPLRSEYPGMHKLQVVIFVQFRHAEGQFTTQLNRSKLGTSPSPQATHLAWLFESNMKAWQLAILFGMVSHWFVQMLSTNPVWQASQYLEFGLQVRQLVRLQGAVEQEEPPLARTNKEEQRRQMLPEEGEQ